MTHIFSTLKVIGEMSRDSLFKWLDHGGAQIGASLAFYTVISIAPFLMMVIWIVGAIYGDDAAHGHIVGQIQSIVGAEGAQAIEQILVNASLPGQGILAKVIGLSAMLFGATTIFSQLRATLDRIWHAPEHKHSSITMFFIARGLAFSALLGVGVLMVVSLVMNAALAATFEYTSDILPGSELMYRSAEMLSSFIMLSTLFALLYRILPSTKIRWRYAFVGGVVTALLFSMGKFLIGWYLSQAAPGSVYGAAGSLVVILFWVYYSAQVILLGAEFTGVFHKRFGEDSLLDPDVDSLV